jgi:hypothetical protein
MTPPDVAEKMFALIDLGDLSSLSDRAADGFVIHEQSVLPFGGEWRGRDALP